MEQAQAQEDNLQKLRIELIIIETRQNLRALGEYVKVLHHDKFRNVLREEWDAIASDVQSYIDK